MRTIGLLLGAARRRGVVVRLEAGELRVGGSGDRADPAVASVVADLRARRDELLEQLVEDHAADVVRRVFPGARELTGSERVSL